MAVEKSAEELRKELLELQRQHREISERLRDPRGIRRGGGAATGGPRQQQQRGVVRKNQAVDSDDQPARKRRLLSTLVTPDGGEVKLEEKRGENANKRPATQDATGNKRDLKFTNNHDNNTDLRRDPNSRIRKNDFNMEPPEPTPRVFPKIEDPNLVKRNRRMLGQLLGTLEKFREEDQKLSNSEAIIRRNDSLKRAEEKAREESENLKKQEKESMAEKRRRDMTLRARVAAKTEEKKLEILFLQWTEHQKKLSNFTRTKAYPPIYYMPSKPLIKDSSTLNEQKEKVLSEWKVARRSELSEFQKKISEEYLLKVEEELNKRNKNKLQNVVPGGEASLAETMDKELETHRLKHGPKKRRVLDGGENEEEDLDEDVEEEDEKEEGGANENEIEN